MRFYFKVHGLVQGIGYRWFVKEIAENYKAVGWVRNVSDGTVEGEIQGEPDKIEKFFADLKDKHPYANVREISNKKIPLREDYTFYIRHSK